MSVKISELPVLSTLADDDILAGVDTSANVTSKVTLSTLKDYVDTNTTYTAGTNIDITNNVISAPNVYSISETDSKIASDISGKEDKSNKVTSLSGSSTNTQYPSAKVVYDELSETNNNVEDLQEQIDNLSTIYNAFPTDSDEDTLISFDGTAETLFKKLDLKGNTSQYTTTGKQLFNKNANVTDSSNITSYTNNNGKYTIIPTGTGNPQLRIQLTIPAGDYTLNSGVYLSLATIIRSSTSSIKNFSDNYSNQNFTITEASAEIVFNWSNPGNTNPITLDLSSLMINTGSVAQPYEEYTGGISSPNPSNPQPVNVVSGDNSINIIGKNLLPMNLTTETYATLNITNNNNGTFTLSGTPTSSFGRNIASSLTLKAGTYTISANNIPDGVYISLDEISDTMLDKNNFSKTFTIASNTTYNNCAIWITKNKAYNQTIQVQIEENTNATTFVPYSKDTYNIDLPVENLFNWNNPRTVELIKSGTRTGSASPVSTFTLLPGTYTLSFPDLVMENNNYNLGVEIVGSGISSSKLVGNSKTFTLAETKTIQNIYYFIDNNDNNNATATFSQIMLEKGSKANSYTPYGTTPIELCKIGNYQDYLFHNIPTNPHYDNTLVEGGWYKYGAINKLLLDGTNLNLRAYSDGTTEDRWAYRTYENTIPKSISEDNLSNCFLRTNTNSKTVPTNTGRLYLYFPKNMGFDVSDATKLNTWLSTHNTSCYYALITPTKTQITYQPLINQLNAIENAMSKKGQTNISQVNNDLPFIINAEAILSLQNVLDRVTLLEG